MEVPHQIPKIIHYCWFGKTSLPEDAQRCIASWKKFCPDYEIVEWNETKINLSALPLYVQQAYAAQKWAFVADYVRLIALYKNGGIYLDTDEKMEKITGFSSDCIHDTRCIHNERYGR